MSRDPRGDRSGHRGADLRPTVRAFALACGATLAATTLTAGPSSAAPPDPGLLSDPRKHSCAELREAGLGPYDRDQDPEYAWYRDDDGDGTACGTREAVTLKPSTDWRTERYTRSRTPTFTVDVVAQPDPGGSGRLRGYLHARILSGEAEVWRHVDEKSTSASRTVRQVRVHPALADGAYVAQVWSSYSGASDEPPSDLASTLTFVVDTQAPSAPTYLGSATAGFASSDAPDVRWIAFADADHAVTQRPAAPGQPVFWFANDPGPSLHVQAIDRAGNVSAAATRDS